MALVHSSFREFRGVEVQRAVHSVASKKAPGPDSLQAESSAAALQPPQLYTPLWHFPHTSLRVARKTIILTRERCEPMPL